MPNRLANETSPYLLQHKDNPVDWYPWGPEALARAKELGRPMLVSIGYSACHWCHVMEHESFEDPEVAEEMNAKFINIKVDREERPDLDNLFMTAVQALSGQGGWPLNVFLTPSGVPFYGGTYFPPEDRSGIPAWSKIIDAVSEAYTTKRDEVEESAEQIAEFLRRSNGADPDRELLSHTLFDTVLENFAAGFDPEHGGFGRAPKFPQASLLVALLRIWHRTKSPVAEKLLTKTLTSMARGGIYDHVGGGFHRYAVDEKWLVPHFEKMLYDNAQLASIYLAAYQAFGEPLYARVATETLDWIVREMTGPQGQFYAAQDADSEGEEGRFYVWTIDDIRAATGAASPTVERYFAVEPGGNFEGRSILQVPVAPAEVATSLGVTPEELQATIDQAISDLYSAREEREHPGRDDKSLAGWNGMALRAFAEGARILDRPDYLAVAVANAEFLLTTQRSRGRLYRTHKDGQAKVPAFLEDFANVIDGLLTLYQATLDERWLNEALDLADVMVAAFGNPNGPGLPHWPSITELNRRQVMRLDGDGSGVGPWLNEAQDALYTAQFNERVATPLGLPTGN